jgi:phosphoserine phosphatase
VPTRCRFASVVFDVDSTLVAIEGIDWLADRRGPAVADAVRQLTSDAMAGRVRLDEVYGKRLQLIAPGPADIAALAEAYVDALASGAAELLERLEDDQVEVALVSGGIRDAILPLARSLGVADERVHAVSLIMDAGGHFTSVAPSPLAEAGGKPTVVAALRPARPALAVGDGITDLEMRPSVDAFAAYTGFARRPAVVSGADAEFADFSALTRWIFGEEVS